MVQLWLAFGHVTGCSFLAPEKFSTQAGTRKAARFQRAVRQLACRRNPLTGFGMLNHAEVCNSAAHASDIFEELIHQAVSISPSFARRSRGNWRPENLKSPVYLSVTSKVSADEVGKRQRYIPLYAMVSETCAIYVSSGWDVPGPGCPTVGALFKNLLQDLCWDSSGASGRDG